MYRYTVRGTGRALRMLAAGSLYLVMSFPYALMVHAAAKLIYRQRHTHGGWVTAGLFVMLMAAVLLPTLIVLPFAKASPPPF